MKNTVLFVALLIFSFKVYSQSAHIGSTKDEIILYATKANWTYQGIINDYLVYSTYIIPDIAYGYTFNANDTCTSYMMMCKDMTLLTSTISALDKNFTIIKPNKEWYDSKDKINMKLILNPESFAINYTKP